MIKFETGTITEEQIRKMTENHLGVRYRYNKKGEFLAYINVWTILVDLFKKIRK